MKNEMLEEAIRRDKHDPLAQYRREFHLPKDMVYLDGNSLGILPLAAKQRATEVVEQQWGDDLITSWNKHQWISLPQRCGEQVATIIGADSGQVVCCDSISINLFKLLSGALAMQKGRAKVVTTIDNFPTDVYMVEGIRSLLGEHQCDLVSVTQEAIESALHDDVAVLLLTQVNFRTGSVIDMQKITQRAHDNGILVIWDLAHSAGVMPVELDNWEVDFAVGCTYKYLNGGPGAPAFIYVAKRHQEVFRQPLRGWMGHAKPFEFNAVYEAKEGIEHNLAGTPAIISMSILNAALAMWSSIDIHSVRLKSMALSQFMLACLKDMEIDKALTLVSPEDVEQRGSQLAFQHPLSYEICQAWIDVGVIVDFRAPDILRVGFAPLYNSFQDVFVACQKLADILQTEKHLLPQYAVKHAVT